MLKLKSSIKEISREITSRYSSNGLNGKHLKQAIDKSLAYVEFDPEGYVINANNKFLKIMGYSLNEIKGQHHRMFCDVVYTNSVDYENFWKTLAKGESNTGEFQRTTASGDLVWLNASYTPVIDDKGEVFRIVKIASDITEMVKIRSQANWVKQSVDTGWGMIEFSSTGHVLGANDNFLNTFGYEELEVLGKHHRMLCTEQYAQSEEYQNFWTKLAEGIVIEGEFERVTKTGDIKYIYATYTPIRDQQGQVVKVTKIASDVTNAARNRQKLDQLINQVSDLSEVLNDASKDTNEQAATANLAVVEMSSAIEQMAEGSQDQRRQLEDVSEFLIGLHRTAKETSQQSLEIQDVAESGVKAAREGKEKLQSLVTSMLGISTSSDIVAASINQIVEQSKEIARALNVITEIANKTNMLSLNAGIQAAKAGSAGKGFSVVAEEIRVLAEDSKQRVQEIDRVINASQTEILKAEEAIKTMGDNVQIGKVVSGNAQEAFEKLEKSTAQTLEKAEAIMESAGVQSDSVSRIVEAVERVVVVSEESATGAEELAASTTQVVSSMNVVEEKSELLMALLENLNMALNQR